MKGFISKYLKLDSYDSDGGVKSERSKNEKKTFADADEDEDSD
jgi:hypothetical protein